MKKHALVSFLCIAAGFSLFFFHVTNEKTGVIKQDESTKINLAIRQMAHHLYLSEGNANARIEPVVQPTKSSYSILLNIPINYDTLPALLDKALSNFQIRDEYYVSIHHCESDSIFLGYNLIAFKNDEIPCLGRDNNNACNIIHVGFEQNVAASNLPLFSAIVFISLGILGFLFGSKITRIYKREHKSLKKENTITLGSTLFYPHMQAVEINGLQYELTFREAKLLEFFATHINQVLKRDNIQDYVWKDEGVIVGRSLDVFISRLRKILKPDPNITIKNIHGVGYKLEFVTKR